MLIALLESEATEETLVDLLAQSQQTMNRDLAALRGAGLIERPRPRGRYRLVHSDETRSLLEAVTRLEGAILSREQLRHESNARRIRRSRLGEAQGTDERSRMSSQPPVRAETVTAEGGKIIGRHRPFMERLRPGVSLLECPSVVASTNDFARREGCTQ